MNATFTSILNATINYKKKNAEGKYDQLQTTAKDCEFKYAPKPSDCTDEKAKTALNNLSKVFDYMESAGVARTDNQRDKATNKAFDFAKAYLKAVGLSDGIGNVLYICSIVAPKRLTTKGVVKGGYTTKSTFVKYALYLTNHYIETGAWVDAKSTKTAKKDENAELWAEMQRNKELVEAQRAELEELRKFYAEHHAA